MSKPIVLVGYGSGRVGLRWAAALAAVGYETIEMDRAACELAAFDKNKVLFSQPTPVDPFTGNKHTFTPPHQRRHGKKKKRGQKRR